MNEQFTFEMARKFEIAHSVLGSEHCNMDGDYYIHEQASSVMQPRLFLA
jgi:hypothetical protein